MDENDGSVTRQLKDIMSGDLAAFDLLWARYYRRLVRIADAKLNSARHLGVAADGEDAALSAFGTFFKGIADGKFNQVSNRDELWRLLAVLTARKAIDQISRAKTRKRGGGRVLNASDLPAASAGLMADWAAALPGREPTPEFTLMVLEQCRMLLEALPDDRVLAIALWRMEGYSREEIAQKLGCSQRTVTYRLEYIRKAWETFER